MILQNEIFCKFYNSVNSDSDNHLYINKFHMNYKNISNTMFSSQKHDIISLTKKQ